MSVLKRHPMLVSLVTGNAAMVALQVGALTYGADTAGGLAFSTIGLLGSATWLAAKEHKPSTERQALRDQKRRNRRAGRSPEAALLMERSDEAQVKVEALEDRLIELTGDIEDVKERAALAEIMYGEHSTYGQAQATIDRIDAELTAMENAEWQRRKAVEAQAEAERLAAMAPEERAEYEEWAAFGGPPRRLGAEELAEVRERVRPVGEPSVSEELAKFDPKPMEVRPRYSGGGIIGRSHGSTLRGEIDTYGAYVWGEPEPVKTWTMNALVDAVRHGVISEEAAHRLTDHGRVVE